jgi:DNA-binding response OmpR family regulator
LLEENHGKYRALITDINLTGQLDGWDVAKLARELNPDMQVIYVTGAAADQWASLGVPNSVLLNKPFAPAQVVTAVPSFCGLSQEQQASPLVDQGSSHSERPAVRSALRR